MSALQRRTVGGGRGEVFSAVAHCNLSIWRRVNCMSAASAAAAKLHMNLYELFALKWIDRHDELQSCLLPACSLLLWLWLPPCCWLVPGAWCRVIAHLPRQARQRSKLLEAAAMQNWKFKWLTWQHVAVLDGHRQQQQPETETKLEQQLVRSCSLSPSLSLSLTLSLALLHVMIKFW